MPALASHQSAKTTKLLLIGDSGAGKTGALASLAAAGYNLRILDFDNGLDVLKNYLTDPNSVYVKQLPNCAENVHFITLTDTSKAVAGRVFPAKADAWQKAMQMLDHWRDGEIDLGKVSTWTDRDILVIDSLSMLSTAAMNFHLSMNGRLGGTPTQNEWRRDIGMTQSLLRQLMDLLKDVSIKCNVIVTSHITMVSDSGEAPKADDSMPSAGYPAAIGRALSPQIPRYFNTVLLAKTSGTGAATRHKIYTKSQGLVNAKNTAPLKVQLEYPLETGLADYFKAVRSS